MHPLITENPTAADPGVKTRRPAARTPAWKRQLAALSRWLHVYLSMVSFAVLFFFAITGVTLNHPDWFSQQRLTHAIGKVNPQWLKASTGQEVAKLEIVEALRRDHGIKGAVSDFRVEDQQCAVSFKGPGYMADAFIDRATGSYDLTETRMGLVAVMNDLHKGRDSGKGWSVVIDVSAILMVLVSLSGMALIFFLPKRRLPGLIAAAVGLMMVYAAYRIWVP